MSARHPLSLRVYLVAGFMVVALGSALVTQLRTRDIADAELVQALTFAATPAPPSRAHTGAPGRAAPAGDAGRRDVVRRLDDRLDREGLGVALLCAVVAAALALALARFVVRPLQGLTALARRLVRDDPELEAGRARGGRETRDMHRALAQLCGALRTREEEQRVAVARVSHESRNALGGILGRIEALRDGVLIDRAGALELIEEDARRLLRQVEDLDRIAVDDGERERSVVDVADNLRGSLRRQAPAARARRVQIKCWSNGEALVCGDREDVTRVVDNLLSNAMRYTDPDGYVFVRVARGAGRVRLEVADSGIGMSEEEVAHVFDAFWRANGAQRRAPQGSGMGLAVVRASVAALGGTIEVTSRAGVGTCFRVDLPAAARPAMAEAQETTLRVA